MSDAMDLVVARGIAPMEDKTGDYYKLRDLVRSDQMDQMKLEAAKQAMPYAIDERRMAHEEAVQDFEDQKTLRQTLRNSGGNLAIALPQLIGQVGVKTWKPLQEFVSKQASEAATTAKNANEATKIEADFVGHIMAGVKEKDYDPHAFAAGLDTIAKTYPRRVPQINALIWQAGQDPREIPDIVDAGISGSGAAQEYLIKKQQADRAATEFGWKKQAQPFEQQKLEAEVAGMKVKNQLEQHKLDLIQNSKPEDMLATVDSIVDPTKHAALNLRTRSLVAFANSRGDIEGAKDIIVKAGEQATSEERHREDMDLRRQGLALTLRGQNMTDSRARELNEITRDTKPATEAERRSYGFYSRAKQASEDLEKFEGDMKAKGLFGQLWYEHAPNFVQSNDNQRYRQAQRAFTEARLRRDSGATIKDEEYVADAKTYFPQPGDTQEVLEQKRRARNAIIQTLRISSGRALREAGEEYTPPSPSPKPSASPKRGGARPPLSSFEKR